MRWLAAAPDRAVVGAAREATVLVFIFADMSSPPSAAVVPRSFGYSNVGDPGLIRVAEALEKNSSVTVVRCVGLRPPATAQ